MKLSKSAQMEIIGLVVIVILISVAFLFMAQFALKDPPAKKVFTRKGLAASTLAAAMKTTIDPLDCGVTSVQEPLSLEKDVLDECAQLLPLYASGFGDSDYCHSGKTSCEFFNDTIESFLTDTLGQWNKRYQLEVERLEGEESEFITFITDERGGCPATRERDTSGTFYLRSGGALVQSVLYICD